MQTTPTIRVLTTTAPDVDWVQYAQSNGVEIVTGDEAINACAAEQDEAVEQ